ncbi:MAG TPA: hypothetical protein ENI62_16060 [Gammaproteobacteria bacterium]|nr:hypothetical protein [Gammaproteobacteria bacterium]
MKFAEEKNRNRIKSYTDTAIRLNESYHKLPMVLHDGRIVTAIELTLYSEFNQNTAHSIIAQQAEIVLLGTGGTLVFPSMEVRHKFLNAGIGLEVMDTPAACRTYNILVNEGRNILAILYPTAE